jgi:aconitate hydratase
VAGPGLRPGLHRHAGTRHGTVVPAISGPKRPQDHTPLDQASDSFFKVVAEYRGLDKSADAKAMAAEGPTPDLAGDPRKTAPVEGEGLRCATAPS